MFIRSQDKDALVNVNDICIYEVNIHSEIIYQFRCYGDSCYILGGYSTKEKALKVLDEIQKRIEYMCPKAFQMPQDEDVV